MITIKKRTKRPDTVADFMATSVISVTPDMDILAASQVLVSNSISGAPVVDEFGRLVGILTERDCFKVTFNAGYFNELGGKVDEYMSPQVETVAPQLSVFELADKFAREKYRRYPVLEDGKLVGMISRHDVLKALLVLSRE